MGRPSNPLDPNGSFAEHYGWKIRTLREAKGWSLEQLAERLACSAGHLSKLEHAHKSPDEQIARLLDATFKTDYFTEHWELAARDQIPAAARSFYEHEAEADRIRVYVPTLVPGLLQIEAYARTLALVSLSADRADEVVAERLRRQQILERKAPPKLLAIVEEGALRRPIGGPEVLREQLAHLDRSLCQPHITIQVVPGRTAAHAGLAGDVTLMSFKEGCDTAFQEGLGGTGRMVVDPDLVARLDEAYDLIRSVALPVDQTRLLIEEIREAL